jgi:hypothetical protein
MTRTTGKTAKKRTRVSNYPAIWDKPRWPAHVDFMMGIYMIPVRGELSIVIYDLFIAGPPDCIPFYTSFTEHIEEVFVWTGKPSPAQKREALEAAKRDGVAAVVHTAQEDVGYWRYAFAQ